MAARDDESDFTREDDDGGAAQVMADGDWVPPAERYATLDQLGVGGMGDVALVRDRLIGRDVALKQLKKETPSARRRFAHEARLQGQLEHPAVVPVYDLGATPQGAPWFT